MSDYLWAKVWWGVALCIGAAIYGAWRGWHGLPLDDEDEGGK